LRKDPKVEMVNRSEITIALDAMGGCENGENGTITLNEYS